MDNWRELISEDIEVAGEQVEILDLIASTRDTDAIDLLSEVIDEYLERYKG